MPTDDWERGYAAGWRAASMGMPHLIPEATVKPRNMKPKKRKVSAYSKRYGAAFRKLSPKYKTKSGSWKKDGFKRCQKAAHREAQK
tara:strand:- start:783 stop:1040 length:258 start_codon:yes stop_codon:yes gene_type:complete